MSRHDEDRDRRSQLPQVRGEIVSVSGSIPERVGNAWARASAIMRVAPAGEDTWSMVELTRAHALIGRKPGCDITIAHPDLETVHTYLHIHSGGCHAVDLRTASGMRLNDRAVTHGRFFPGDVLEVGGFRIRLDGLIVNGRPLKSEDYGDSPLSDDTHCLVGLQLRSLSRQAHYWSVHSSIAFVGSEPSCAVALPAELGVSRIHGALVRTDTDVFYVDLASRGSQINGHHLFNDCRPLFHEDVLTVGRAGLLIHRSDSRKTAAPVDPEVSRRDVSRNVSGIETETLLAALLSRIQEQHDSALERQNESQVAIAQLLRQMQNEQSRVFEKHLDRIARMDQEITQLKARLKTGETAEAQQLTPPSRDDLARIRPNPAQAPPAKKPAARPAPAAERPDSPRKKPPEPIRAAADSRDPDASPEFTTAWLIDRVSQLEHDKNKSWRDLIDRLRGR